MAAFVGRPGFDMKRVNSSPGLGLPIRSTIGNEFEGSTATARTISALQQVREAKAALDDDLRRSKVASSYGTTGAPDGRTGWRRAGVSGEAAEGAAGTGSGIAGVSPGKKLNRPSGDKTLDAYTSAKHRSGVPAAPPGTRGEEAGPSSFGWGSKPALNCLQEDGLSDWGSLVSDTTTTLDSTTDASRAAQGTSGDFVQHRSPLEMRNREVQAYVDRQSDRILENKREKGDAAAVDYLSPREGWEGTRAGTQSSRTTVNKMPFYGSRVSDLHAECSRV